MWSSVYDNACVVVDLYAHAALPEPEGEAATKILKIVHGFAHRDSPE